MKNYSRIQKIWHFIILLATIALCRKLSKNNEFLAMRLAGLSMLRITLPMIIVVLLLGILHLSVLHQISANMLERYQNYEAKLLKSKENVVSLSQSGIWFRQLQKDQLIIIHGKKIRASDRKIYDVEMYFFDQHYNFLKRVDCKELKVKLDYVLAQGVTSWDKNYRMVRHDLLRLPINIEFDRMSDNLILPETMSILKLIEFIEFAKSSGVSSIKYQLYLEKLLLSTIIWLIMVFLGRIFCSVRPKLLRTQSITISIILMCFIIYFALDFFTALAISGFIPVIIASLAPIFIAAILCCYFILQYEYI